MPSLRSDEVLPFDVSSLEPVIDTVVGSRIGSGRKGTNRIRPTAGDPISDYSGDPISDR